MSFSQRFGFTPVRSKIQVDGIDDALRNSLWNALHSLFWSDTKTGSVFGYSNKPLESLLTSIWKDMFKLPIDKMPHDLSDAVAMIRKAFFDPVTPWYFIYDLIEFISLHVQAIESSYEIKFRNVTHLKYVTHCNQVLEKEMSGYRIVDGIITAITSGLEIDEIEQSINTKSNKFAGMSTHIKQALNLMSDRSNPDFRNSIKESISAVESVCKIITQNPKATLGEGLKKLEESSVPLHPSLKESFNKLYGYTSDEKGIRHGFTDGNNQFSFEDAKYMLVTCSAFCNYLISKIS